MNSEQVNKCTYIFCCKTKNISLYYNLEEFDVREETDYFQSNQDKFETLKHKSHSSFNTHNYYYIIKIIDLLYYKANLLFEKVHELLFVKTASHLSVQQFEGFIHCMKPLLEELMKNIVQLKYYNQSAFGASFKSSVGYVPYISLP